MENEKIWEKIDKEWETTDNYDCSDMGIDGAQKECDETLCEKHHQIYREEVAERFRNDEREKLTDILEEELRIHKNTDNGDVYRFVKALLARLKSGVSEPSEGKRKERKRMEESKH